jgi:hypothetical protein
MIRVHSPANKRADQYSGTYTNQHAGSEGWRKTRLVVVGARQLRTGVGRIREVEASSVHDQTDHGANAGTHERLGANLRVTVRRRLISRWDE